MAQIETPVPGETAARHVPATAQRAMPVEGYPSLRTAAALIGVHASTLSRRDDVVRIRVGREDRVPAAEVLRLASEYGKRRLSRVAGELVERAGRGDAQADIAHEVDEALERFGQQPTRPALEAFLADARRLLPPALVAQIEASLSAGSGGEPSSVGWSPPDDS